MGYYILKGKKPVQVDFPHWMIWHEKDNRQVALTTIEETRISTVFLGMGFTPLGGELYLFESMVFGGELNGYQLKYKTWEEAEKGHQEIVDEILKQQKPE